MNKWKSVYNDIYSYEKCIYRNMYLIQRDRIAWSRFVDKLQDRLYENVLENVGTKFMRSFDE